MLELESDLSTCDINCEFNCVLMAKNCLNAGCLSFPAFKHFFVPGQFGASLRVIMNMILFLKVRDWISNNFIVWFVVSSSNQDPRTIILLLSICVYLIKVWHEVHVIRLADVSPDSSPCGYNLDVDQWMFLYRLLNIRICPHQCRFQRSTRTKN